MFHAELDNADHFLNALTTKFPRFRILTYPKYTRLRVFTNHWISEVMFLFLGEIITLRISDPIRRVMSAVLNLSVIITLVYYYSLVQAKAAPLFLSAIIFTLVLAVNILTSRRYKELSFEISLISLFLFSLLLMCYFYYVETTNSLTQSLLIKIFVVFLLVSNLPWIISMSAVSLEKQHNEPEMGSELKSRIMSLFQHSGLIPAFFFFITASVFMKLIEKIYMSYGILVKFSLIGLTWVSLGNIFTLLFMRRWSYLDGLIFSLVERKLTLEAEQKRKLLFFLLFPIVVFFIGLIIDFSHNAFILSVAVVVIISALLLMWKTWRYALASRNHNVPVIEPNEIKKIPSLTEPTYFIKFVAICTILGFLYFLILLVL